MEFILKDFPEIDEKYYEGTHASGLKIYVIPKNHTTAYAVFGTKFGSIDNLFEDGKQGVVKLPDGIAHFLEHKLFENEDGTDTFARYAKFGGNANAYTSSDSTVYLFSATENIPENLEILLDFVTHPYFTEETVNKEMGIIGEEIRMYDDNPDWRLYFNLLRALYKDNPVRIDTAGTEKTIAEITPEKLFKAYNSFYNLHNMALVVCGNISPEQVSEVADKVLPAKEVEKPTIKRIYPDEQENVATEKISEKMQVAMPMVYVGIKDPSAHLYGKELMKRCAAYDILLDVMFGRSSRFYNENYARGIVNKSFSATEEIRERFAFCIVGGITEKPQELVSAIKAEAQCFVANGIPEEDFEMAKRKHYAGSIRVFDSTDDVANSFLGFKFGGCDLFEYPAVLQSITREDVQKLVCEVFADGHFAVSEILPLD